MTFTYQRSSFKEVADVIVSLGDKLGRGACIHFSSKEFSFHFKISHLQTYLESLFDDLLLL